MEQTYAIVVHNRISQHGEIRLVADDADEMTIWSSALARLQRGQDAVAWR